MPSGTTRPDLGAAPAPGGYPQQARALPLVVRPHRSAGCARLQDRLGGQRATSAPPAPSTSRSESLTLRTSPHEEVASSTRSTRPTPASASSRRRVDRAFYLDSGPALARQRPGHGRWSRSWCRPLSAHHRPAHVDAAKEILIHAAGHAPGQPRRAPARAARARRSSSPCSQAEPRRRSQDDLRFVQDLGPHPTRAGRAGIEDRQPHLPRGHPPRYSPSRPSRPCLRVRAPVAPRGRAARPGALC